MPAFRDLIHVAEKAQSMGLLKTAVTRAEQALACARNAEDRAFACYTVGALYWGEIGDGLSARSWFEKTAVHWKQAVEETGGRLRGTVSLLAYAAENLALLSLSIDEYRKWTEELRREAPDEVFLRENAKSVLDAHERGESWADIMLAEVMPFIRREKVGGGDNPAAGACILQLLIHNRKQLRAARLTWRGALVGYCLASSRAAGRAEQLILRDTGHPQPQEIEIAEQFVLEYLDDYLREYPDDRDLSKMRDLTRLNLRAAGAMAESQASPAVLPNLPSAPPPSAASAVAENWEGALISMALGLSVFFIDVPSVFKWVGGVLIAFGGMGVLVALNEHRGAVPKGDGALAEDHLLPEPGEIHGQFLQTSPKSWCRNAVIEKELRARGLNGIGFKLTGYEVQGLGYLYLHFRALGEVSEDKRRFAHMALRSIVALTLPNVIKGIAGLRLLETPSYTIGFGDGVTVPLYSIQAVVDSWPLLSVGSEVSGDHYEIYIHPSVVKEKDELAWMMAGGTAGPGVEIQTRVGQTFVALFGEGTLRL